MANFDRIYDSLHKSEKRKAELEAKIKPLEETIARLEHDAERLRVELDQANRERLAFSKEVASIAQTKEALQQENTTLRGAMHHTQQALKTANLQNSAAAAAFLKEKQQLVMTLEQANDSYALYRELLPATTASSGGEPAARAQFASQQTNAPEQEATINAIKSSQAQLKETDANKSQLEQYCHQLEDKLQRTQDHFAAYTDIVHQFLKSHGVSDKTFELHLASAGFQQSDQQMPGGGNEQATAELGSFATEPI